MLPRVLQWLAYAAFVGVLAMESDDSLAVADDGVSGNVIEEADVFMTSDRWKAETAGKVVFVKFLSPVCPHCKKLKPDWDRLMMLYKDSATSGVYDVDCMDKKS